MAAEDRLALLSTYTVKRYSSKRERMSREVLTFAGELGDG